MDKEFEKYINEEIEKFKANLINEFKEYERKIDGNTYIPNKDDEYFFIDGVGGINSWCWKGGIGDEKGLSIGNVFKTKEEAEFEAERLKVLATMKWYSRPFNLGGGNWFISWDRNSNNIEIDCSIWSDHGVLVFEDKSIIQKVVDEIGEERLKKYYFRSEVE